MSHSRGYALLAVLAVSALLFMLATSFSMSVKAGAENALDISAGIEGINAADSGLQYALEAIRQSPAQNPWWQNHQITGSAWDAVENHPGKSICFKVFAIGGPDGQNHLNVESYGEVVQGDCGDYPKDLSRLWAVRKVAAVVDLNTDNLVSWQEVH